MFKAPLPRATRRGRALRNAALVRGAAPPSRQPCHPRAPRGRAPALLSGPWSPARPFPRFLLSPLQVLPRLRRPGRRVLLLLLGPLLQQIRTRGLAGVGVTQRDADRSAVQSKARTKVVAAQALA